VDVLLLISCWGYPEVLDSDLNKNFSKTGMMEEIDFVMPRLTKMVHRRNTRVAAMTERTRRGQMRSGKTMEMAEMVVWRTRDAAGIHLQALLGWWMMTGATRINCSRLTALGLDHRVTSFSPTRLVGSGPHSWGSWIPTTLWICRSLAAALALCWKRKTKAMSAPLKVLSDKWLTPLSLLFIVVSFIGVIY
jgi:hypothetical protein